MSNHNKQNGNVILIGHTTVCEAARLFSETEPTVSVGTVGYRYHPPRFILRFLELCALVEAAVLHDTLFTLPAELPSDVDQLELRTRLLNAGVLHEYSPSVLFTEVIPSLRDWIVNNAKQLEHGPGPYGRFHATEGVPLILNTLAKMTDQNYERLVERSYYREGTGINDVEMRELDTLNRIVQILQYDDFLGENGALSSMVGKVGLDISYFGSGAYEHAIPTLRTLMYWQLSEKVKVPWYPDVLRVPIMVTLNRQLRASLGAQVYAIVAEAFATTVEELIDAEVPHEIVIPPLIATLLGRCSKRQDILDELFTLREEFADFRQTFREFEKRRRSAKSIKEWRSLHAEIRRLYKSVASNYRNTDRSFIENALGYAPDVLKPLKNPLDPSNYSGELLGKPYDWIQKWWYQRPASRLFSVTKKLEQLELYGQLVRRIFQVEITSGDATFIREYYATVHNLTKHLEFDLPDTKT